MLGLALINIQLREGGDDQIKYKFCDNYLSEVKNAHQIAIPQSRIEDAGKGCSFLEKIPLCLRHSGFIIMFPIV
jgi:hypothetical protein